MTDTDFNIDDQEPEFKSKTQLKNEMRAIQKVGEQLVALGPAALDKMPLDAELAEAVALARRIDKKKEGYRRQLQLIGKMMRHRDTQPIEQALEQLQMSHRQATSQFHHIEQARDRVLSQGDSAINALLTEYPQLDRQKLRQLYRQAQKQKEQNSPPKAARELFQYLKQQLQD